MMNGLRDSSFLLLSIILVLIQSFDTGVVNLTQVCILKPKTDFAPFQEWSMTKSGHVKHGDLCLGIEGANPGTGLRLRTCGNSQLQVRQQKLLGFISMDILG